MLVAGGRDLEGSRSNLARRKPKHYRLDATFAQNDANCGVSHSACDVNALITTETRSHVENLPESMDRNGSSRLRIAALSLLFSVTPCLVVGGNR